MSVFKHEVVRELAPAASAVLLDPEVGAAQCIASSSLPGDTGLIIALEATGYSGDTHSRESHLLPGWSAIKARHMGASAVKLLVYYHPEAPTAGQIENLVARVHEDCCEADIPLMLEPLTYSLGPANKQLTGTHRTDIILQTAEQLTSLGGDVLKVEFPIDIASEPDESAWEDGCRQLDHASQVPWVLLSASVEYETYLRQVRVACEQGASGVAVGRAVWQEATDLSGQARADFLHNIALPRMQQIASLCDALARPWTDCYHANAQTWTPIA